MHFGQRYPWIVSGRIEKVVRSLKQGTHNLSEVSSSSLPHNTQNALPSAMTLPPDGFSPPAMRLNPLVGKIQRLFFLFVL